MWDFQLKEISKLSVSHEAYARACDTMDHIPPIRWSRGHGGVAIFWNKKLNPFMNKLDDGNERIIAVELSTGCDKWCIICVYLPTQGGSIALDQLADCLDALYVIMCKYSATHSVVICGDFNSSLVRAKPQDKLLQSFASETNLRLPGDMGTQATFTHPNGKWTSQIDYMFTNNTANTKHDLCVLVEDLNCSCHDILSLTMLVTRQATQSTMHGNTKNGRPALKFHWDEVDVTRMEEKFCELLPKDLFDNQGGGQPSLRHQLLRSPEPSRELPRLQFPRKRSRCTVRSSRLHQMC